MSADSTELTFVRCPACRSLVPAVSTRCRMCGVTLDASAGATDNEVKGSGRVRQRTMSQPSELASTVGRIREELSNASAASTDSPITKMDNSVEAEEGAIDPLSAYVEEIEISEGSSDEESVMPDDWNSPLEEGDGGELPDESTADHGKGLSEVEHRTDSHGANGVSGFAPDEIEPTYAEPVRKVIIDVPGQRNEKSFSFSKKAGEQEMREEGNTNDDGGSISSKSDEGQYSREGRTEKQADRSEVAPKRRPSPTKPVHSGAERVGRLIGWLVSYSDPEGTAIELREGKFFLSGSSLKASDLVVADKSISTPHAILTVSANSGFL